MPVQQPNRRLRGDVPVADQREDGGCRSQTWMASRPEVERPGRCDPRLQRLGASDGSRYT